MISKMKKKSFLCLLMFFFLGSSASAALITSFADYSGPGLDLSAYQNGSYNFTFGPEILPGGITFTAAPGGDAYQGSVIGQGTYGLGANGVFGLDAVYIGVDSGTGYAQFDFDSPISSFGAYFNYAPGVGDNATISVLDSLDKVIKSYDLTIDAPISTPGGINLFEFRGIDLGVNTFSKFRFGGNYILAAATPDGSPVQPVPVPEPGTLLLLGSGLAGLALYRRRMNKA